VNFIRKTATFKNILVLRQIVEIHLSSAKQQEKMMRRKRARDSFSDSGWSSDEESLAEPEWSTGEASEWEGQQITEQEENSKNNEAGEDTETDRDNLPTNLAGSTRMKNQQDGERKAEKRKLDKPEGREPPTKKFCREGEAKPTVRRSPPYAYYTSKKDVSSETRLLPVQQIIGTRWRGVLGGRKLLQLKLKWTPVQGVQPKELWVFKHNTQGMEGLLQRWNHKCYVGWQEL
jgi:hypothetical protein